MNNKINLHAHQKDALSRVADAIVNGAGRTLGRIVIPTGGGKTFVEAAVLDYQFKNNSHTRYHLVLAPRIVLSKQLLDEYRTFLGADFRAVAFHSGTYDSEQYDDIIDWDERAVRSYDAVVEEHVKAMVDGKDLVIFSTYHSADRLNKIDFDTIIADESQYCVGEGFHETVRNLDGRVKLFFTATERYTSGTNGRGLNNLSVYGPRIYDITPQELIARGLIVPPRLHVAHITSADGNVNIIDEVVELAREQNKITSPNLGFSKILFAMEGTEDVKTVEDNINRIRTVMPEHTIYTITSKNGAKINGSPVDRDYFMDALRNGTHTNVLIFHYDILSEGIDIQGITGVAILRNMSLSKLQQTIGRALRTYKPNPKLKKYALVSTTIVNNNDDDYEHVRELITGMRDGGWDVTIDTIVESGMPNHQGDAVDVNDAYGDYKVNKVTGIIEQVNHSIEEEKLFDFYANAELNDIFKTLVEEA